MSDQQSEGASILGTIATIGSFILFKLSIGEWAAIVAIITGLTTIAVNVQRFIHNRKTK